MNVHIPSSRSRNLANGAARIGIVAAIVAAGLVGWGIFSRIEARAALVKEADDQAAPTVAVIKAEKNTGTEDLVLPGNIRASADAPIYARSSGYVKRWPDENDPDLMRYTASPCEISLVDLPCLPSATFAMIKADGAIETMKFASFDNAVEQVWLAGDGKTFKKKAEALAHQALLASSASMLGALERMENDLGKAAPGARTQAARTQALDRLRKCLGQEAFDAGRAIAALRIVFDVLAADQLGLYVQTATGWSPVTKATLKPWQVPALQGVGVVSDGSAPPPPAPASASASPTIVPYVPKVC